MIFKKIQPALENILIKKNKNIIILMKKDLYGLQLIKVVVILIELFMELLLKNAEMIL